MRQDTLGLITAFGAGVLISAVAYELVAEAIDTGEKFAPVAGGLSAGALTFYVGDRSSTGWAARSESTPTRRRAARRSR